MAKGTFSRIADIVRAEVDDMLSRVEDPEKLVRQMVRDMEDAVDEAIAGVGRAVANEKLLGRRVKAQQEAVARWQQKAEGAVEAGEEELARRALQQKLAAMEEVEQLEQARAEAVQVTEQLKGQLERLKARVQEARARQRTLISRQGLARRRGTLVQHPPRVREDAFDQFDELCRRVDRAEVEAEVYEEVAGRQPELEDTFERMEQKQRVEEELRALKQKASGQTPQAG